MRLHCIMVLSLVADCCLAQELPDYEISDICFYQNNSYLLVNKGLSSFVANENSLNFILEDAGEEEIGVNAAGDFFIRDYDGEHAEYIASIRGKTFLASTTVGKYGYNETQIDLDFPFAPYAGFPLSENEYVLFGLNTMFNYKISQSSKTNDISMVWIDREAKVKKTVKIKDLQAAVIHKVVRNKNGEYLILYSYEHITGYIFGYGLVKLSSSGEVQWKNSSLGEWQHAEGGSLWVEEDSIYLLLEYSYAAEENVDSKRDTGLQVIKMDSSGKEIWNKKIEEKGKQIPVEIFPCKDGMVCISRNFSEEPLLKHDDVDVIVLDKEGTEVRRLYDYEPGFNYDPATARISGAGDLYVVGTKTDKSSSKRSGFVFRFSKKKIDGEKAMFWE
ncbi:MAG: hypothetical protein JXR23_10535 [Pontiellaceae bacterium]|nr:hypothetical protein [Pontiellaceae bacterium]